MGAVAQSIQEKLTTIFAPDSLEVEDQSEQHRGHVGFREGGETHFHVRIVAEKFRGQNRVNRQRLVYGALADELAGPVHALSLEIKAPGE